MVKPATKAAKDVMPRTLNRKPITREKDPKILWITEKSIHRLRGLKQQPQAEDQRKQAGSIKLKKVSDAYRGIKLARRCAPCYSLGAGR